MPPSVAPSLLRPSNRPNKTVTLVTKQQSSDITSTSAHLTTTFVCAIVRSGILIPSKLSYRSNRLLWRDTRTKHLFSVVISTITRSEFVEEKKIVINNRPIVSKKFTYNFSLFRHDCAIFCENHTPTYTSTSRLWFFRKSHA